MIGGPVSCTLPLALLHIVAGNNCHTDVFDMKLQKGMLRSALDNSIPCEAFSDCWENLLHPLLPFHRGRKPGKDVQISFAANPSISRERPLESDLSLNLGTSENLLNLTSNNLRQPDHFLSLAVAWNDFLGSSLQDFLGRRRQAGAAQNMIVFEMSKCTSLFVGRSLEESRIRWS